MLEMILTIIGVHQILLAIIPNSLPEGIKEFIRFYFKAEVKAYRIFYPVLIILLTLEPQSWWKVLIMVVLIENSVRIATPIANWTCSKLGF
jgi:hypothetical protein